MSPVEPDQYVWRRVVSDSFNCDDYVEMHSVAVGDAGFVAVGWCDEDGAIWISVSGEEWRRVGSAVLGGPGTQRITSVGVGEPGFVAVGLDYAFEDTPQEVDAAVWFSTDGNGWERIDSDSLGGPKYQEIWSVIWTGERFIAAGGDAEDCPVCGTNLGIWLSESGRDWVQVPYESIPNSLGTGFVDSPDWNIAHDGTTVVVVSNTAAWRSQDHGLTWESIEDAPSRSEEAPNAGFITVAAGADGFVAIDGEANLWASSDGAEWKPVSQLNLAALGLESIDAPAALGAWTWIGGHQHKQDVSDVGNAILLSDDYISWDPVTASTSNPPKYIEINAIAVFNGGLIAVGSVGTDHPWQEAGVWIATPTDR